MKKKIAQTLAGKGILHIFAALLQDEILFSLVKTNPKKVLLHDLYSFGNALIHIFYVQHF